MHLLRLSRIRRKKGNPSTSFGYFKASLAIFFIASLLFDPVKADCKPMPTTTPLAHSSYTSSV